MVRLDASSAGSLDGSSEEPFGALALLAVGFTQLEFDRLRKLLHEDMEAEMVKVGGWLWVGGWEGRCLKGHMPCACMHACMYAFVCWLHSRVRCLLLTVWPAPRAVPSPPCVPSPPAVPHAAGRYGAVPQL